MDTGVRLVVCILTVDRPSRLDAWIEWANESVQIFVNGKHDFEVPLPARRIAREKRDTRWGDCSLVLAEQCLVREALAVHSATHVLLVQGDSCPMQPCASVLSQIAAEVRAGEAGFQMTHSNRGTPSPKINLRTSRDIVHNMAVSLERADAGNWWKRVFAYKDDEGAFLTDDVKDPRFVCFHSQMFVLSRDAAELFARMPQEVATDYDRLFGDAVMRLGDEDTTCRCMPCEEVVVRAWLRGVCGVSTVWLKRLMFERDDPNDVRRKATFSSLPDGATTFWFARKLA